MNALILVVLGLIAAFLVLRLVFAKGRGPLRAPSEVLSDSDAGKDAKRIWRTMQRQALPTLLLAPTTAPGGSRMGGVPELPAGCAWPTDADGPLAFVAQLDLSEIATANGPDWLPRAGALHIFAGELSDSPDLVRVIFASERGQAASQAPHSLPAKRQFVERRVAFLPLRSIPSLDWLGEDVREIDVEDDELDALADAPDEPFGDQLQHRIGGYPSEIQDEQMALAAEYASRGLARDHDEPTPKAIAKAAQDWRLLLQVDSDPALKMSWGDAGRLYVFIREADARVADFSKAVTLWQTH